MGIVNKIASVFKSNTDERNYATVRGESDIVREKIVHDNTKIRVYEGYLKEYLKAAKITRISSISLGSEAQSESEIESMLTSLEAERKALYSDLDSILQTVVPESDEESDDEFKKLRDELDILSAQIHEEEQTQDDIGEREDIEALEDIEELEKEYEIKIQKWRVAVVNKLKELVRGTNSRSFISKFFENITTVMTRNKSEVKEDDYQLTDSKILKFEKEVTEIYSDIMQVEAEISALSYVRIQDTVADFEKESLDAMYDDILKQIRENSSLSKEYKANLIAHYQREKSKHKMAKNQNLDGYKRELYRVDDEFQKRSIFCSRVIPASHDMISEMSDIRGAGYKSAKIENWKDNLIWAFLVFSNLISLGIAFSDWAREFFTKPSTWGYASGYFVAFTVTWVLFSQIGANLGAWEAVYNIEKVSKNETVTYFDSDGNLQTIVTDIYELELINSSRNNLDVSLGRSANDVANLTNQTLVRMARELSKQVTNLVSEIDVANKEKQTLLDRIEDLKSDTSFAYHQGLVDGAQMRGQVLLQLGETRNIKSQDKLLTPDVIKYIVIAISVVGVLIFLFNMISKTDLVIDLTSPLIGYFIAFIFTILLLVALSMIISNSRSR